MSPERDEPIEDQEQDLYEDVPPRSIFAATWFRVVLVVIVLGVVGAVAVPYVLDWMNPPPMSRTASSSRPSMTPAPSTTTNPVVPDKPVIDRPLTDKPPADKPAGDRSAMDKAPADKKDSILASPPARPEPKSEGRPSPSTSTARPAPDPKATAKATTPEPMRPAPSAGENKAPGAMMSTDTPAKTAVAKPSPAKPDAVAKDDAGASKAAAAKRAVARATPPAASAAGGAGPYWVQIGAFKDAGTAKRVAAKLREENFKVEESIKRVGGTATAAAPTVSAPAPPAGAADQYDVFVSGMSVDELNKRLAGKGLAAEPASGGVVVKPSLPLRDAVALSKDLAVDGFKVQVRRAGAAATAPAVVSAPTAPVEGGQTLHRVRVGAFTDRAAALATARELESKGFKPYIARGDQ